MPMKKILFLSALVVMGFACVGCTTTDNNTDTTPIESTTPTTDNINGTTTDGTTMDGTTMNGTTTNGTTTNDTTMNGTTTNSTDNAANGVVTDKNGIINDGTTTNNSSTTK